MANEFSLLITQTANLPGKIGGEMRQSEGKAALDLAELGRHKILWGRRRNER